MAHRSPTGASPDYSRSAPRGVVVQAASLYLGNTGKLPVLQLAPVNNPGQTEEHDGLAFSLLMEWLSSRSLRSLQPQPFFAALEGLSTFVASKSRITVPISAGHWGQSQKAVSPGGAAVVRMSPAGISPDPPGKDRSLGVWIWNHSWLSVVMRTSYNLIN